MNGGTKVRNKKTFVEEICQFLKSVTSHLTSFFSVPLWQQGGTAQCCGSPDEAATAFIKGIAPECHVPLQEQCGL